MSAAVMAGRVTYGGIGMETKCMAWRSVSLCIVSGHHKIIQVGGMHSFKTQVGDEVA